MSDGVDIDRVHQRFLSIEPGRQYTLPSGRVIEVIQPTTRRSTVGWQCWYVAENGKIEDGRADEHSVVLRDDWLRVHGVAL